MDCQEFTKEPLKQEIENDRNILILAFRERVSTIISELRSTGEQRFVSMGFNERVLGGKYDAAIIDGSSAFLNPFAVFESQFPYLQHSVDKFYILR